MKFKQLFCHHIWKQIATEHLGTVIVQWSMHLHYKHKRIAYTEVCVKCDKHRCTEGRTADVACQSDGAVSGE